MSREFFRFDLSGIEGGKVSVMAHHITHLEDLSIVKKAKDGSQVQVTGTRVHLTSGHHVDVTEVREFIFGMDQWQIFKKAGR